MTKEDGAIGGIHWDALKYSERLRIVSQSTLPTCLAGARWSQLTTYERDVLYEMNWLQAVLQGAETAIKRTVEAVHTCKFCDYVWSYNNPCEYSFDQETCEVVYCGNQECPCCKSCQGRTDVTPETRANAAKMRAIFEGRP